MDYADAATQVLAVVAGLSALGAASFAVYLLIRGFTWGRRVTK